VSKDNMEYLEIDLGTLKVVTLIETQGRFGQGQVSEQFEHNHLIHLNK